MYKFVLDLLNGRSPFIMMTVGVPGSGKSSWARQFREEYYYCIDSYNLPERKLYTFSTDALIEAHANKLHQTYSDVFQDYIGTATDIVNNGIKICIANSFNIVLDQTNLTANSRRKKLSIYPSNYLRVAVVFPTPEKETHENILNSRPGKIIPPNVIDNMIKTYQAPTLEEGFDYILSVEYSDGYFIDTTNPSDL